MNAPAREIRPEAAESVQRDGALAPPLEKTRLYLYIAQVALDLTAIVVAFSLASFTYFGDWWDDRTMLVAQVLVPLYLIIALYNATFSLATLSDMRSSALRMLTALALSAGLLGFALFYTKLSVTFSRGSFTLGFAYAGVLMLNARLFFIGWIRRRFGGSVTNRLIIDDGGPPLVLPHAYQVSAEAHGLSPSLDDPHGLDRLGNYMRNMDHVIVSCAPEKRMAWSRVLKGSGVSGEVISATAHELGALGVRHYDEAGLASLVVSTGALGLRARAAKRLFDVAFSASALLLLSPLLVAVALLIAITDGSPVLFCQRRLGRGNRFFIVYKFRTMAAEHGDADGNRSASRDDDRVSPLGRFLRASSIDELPQLLNVLAGDMSVVGPRPHAIGSQAGDKLFWEVDRRYWQRHSLKPGMTGLAQIRGLRGATAGEEDLRLRLQSDLEYLNGWSACPVTPVTSARLPEPLPVIPDRYPLCPFPSQAG